MGIRVAFLDRQAPARPRSLAVLVPADAVRAAGDAGVVFVITDGFMNAMCTAHFGQPPLPCGIFNPVDE